MTLSQLFVALVALASLGSCIWAIWLVARSERAKYKPLWILGSLFGFVGCSTGFVVPSDLLLHFGFQIPVLLWNNPQPGQLTAAFPVIAAIAIVEFRKSE